MRYSYKHVVRTGADVINHNSIMVVSFQVCLLWCICVVCLRERFVSLAGARIEEFLYEKLERKIPPRATNGEILGQYMLEAGKEFGADTPYGKRSQSDRLTNMNDFISHYIHRESGGFLASCFSGYPGDLHMLQISVIVNV